MSDVSPHCAVGFPLCAVLGAPGVEESQVVREALFGRTQFLPAVLTKGKAPGVRRVVGDVLFREPPAELAS